MTVTLYTWSACKHCETARRLLDSHEVDYDEHALDADRETKRKLAETLGRADMPYLRVGNRVMGGVAEVRAWLEARAVGER